MRRALVDGLEPIPLLEDLLGAWPELRVNIDPKHDDAVEPLIETLRRPTQSAGSASAPSRDDRIARVARRPSRRLHLARAERLAPARPGREPATAGVGELPAPCAQLPPTYVDTPDRHGASSSAEAHRRGMQVHAWTIDDPARCTALLDLGVDGIMTDRPAVLKRGPVGDGANGTRLIGETWANWTSASTRRCLVPPPPSEAILTEMLGDDLPVRVRAYDGTDFGPPDAPATLVVRSPDALRRIVTAPGELGFARAYVAGDLDVEGDIYAALDLHDRLPDVRLHARRRLAAIVPPARP